MARSRFTDPIEPMTLADIRAILSAERRPDSTPVPAFGPRMVCTRCGIIGAAPGRTGKSSRRGTA